jgi:hypothetical protein
MAGVICIDFGTSSIRAAWQRGNRGGPEALPVGRACKSRLDDDSIRSDIHIDVAEGIVSFGERGWSAGQGARAKDDFLESSPKLWLTRPSELAERPVPSLAVSRRDLLTWLIAFAIDASCRAGRSTKKDLRDTEVRVAHPVWPLDVGGEANRELEHVARVAKQVFLSGPVKEQVHVKDLGSRVRDVASESASAVDVVEPIAAALTLLPWDDNVRRLCAIVDIGAGTTDVGLFHVVAPDQRTRAPSKLIPIGRPVSVYKAGNFLDELVMKLLLEGGPGRPGRSTGVEEVQRRIRQVKEALFKDGVIRELGVRLELNRLAEHQSTKTMTREIRNALVDLVSENASTVFELMGARTHRAQGLEIVLAGGGAGIPFIRKQMAKSISVGGATVNVILEPQARSRRTDGANPERLAVALGGANEVYATLVREIADQQGVVRRGAI